ncbi:MAG: hypothetical protein JWN48_5132 [Myxococcaceae bacterium]|nr:hypothetical protein [Myxococcaceae bacterium]
MHRLVCGVLIAAALIVSVLGGATARADDHAEPNAYRELVDQAFVEFQANNYEEAGVLFSRANTVFPNARALRGMGLAAFELRRYDECVAHLQAALDSQIKPLEGELRERTAELLLRARGFLARVTVALNPESAQLRVDGQPQHERGPFSLKLGDHVLEAYAAGYLPQKELVRVRGGEDIRLSITLDRELLRASPVERPRARSRSAWLWAAAGVVVVGAVLTGVLVATRDHDHVRRVATPTSDTPVGFVLSSLGVAR